MSSQNTDERLVYGPKYADLRRLAKKTHVGLVEYVSLGQLIVRDIDTPPNTYYLDGNVVSFYPMNDGESKSSRTYAFKPPPKQEKNVLTNERNYKEISNLDALLLTATRVMDATLDSEVIVAPFGGFYLDLQEPVFAPYSGLAELLLLNHNPHEYEREGKKVQDLTAQEIESVQMRFANVYLDYFIGWNFGFCVRRNPRLQEALKGFNRTLIAKGMRKRIGQGFELHNDASWFFDFEKE